MIKTAYFDMPDTPITELEKGLLVNGDVYLSESKLLIVHKAEAKMLFAIKGKKVRRRKFTNPISTKWLARRINGFAEDVRQNERVDMPALKAAEPKSKSQEKRIAVQKDKPNRQRRSRTKVISEEQSA